MDWIRENKTLATLMGVFLAAALGLGFVLVTSYSAYAESRQRFDNANNSLAGMKSADLYPSQENLDKKKALVGEYEKKVTDLGRVLLLLQPTVEPISETDFQAKLKTKIAEVRTKAGKVTQLPGDFALGFSEYTASLPKSAAIAKELADYLDASEAVVNTLIDAGVDSVESFERSQLGSESGEAAAVAAPPPPPPPSRPGMPAPRPRLPQKPSVAPKEVAKMVERRTLTITLTSDQGSLQTVLNQLASPSKMPHFTAIRLMRIENEKNEGPMRAMVAQELSRNQTPPPEEGSDQVVVSPDGTAEAAPAGPEVLAAPKPANKDAVGVLGQEKLKVYLEIDLIKFITTENEVADGAAAK
jgi:hypothetical protein